MTIWVHDRNGNLVSTIGPAKRGTDDNSLTAVIKDAFCTSQDLMHEGDWLAENEYDGFDRVINTTDAVGNVVNYKHDPGGRVVDTEHLGPIGDEPTPDNREGLDNVQLSHSQARFDEAGRQYEAQQAVFLATGTTLPSGRDITHNGGGLEPNSTANTHTGPAILTPPESESSYVLQRTVHDRAGRVFQTVQDNTKFYQYEYDGANRRIRETQADTNLETVYGYDPNSNLILVEEHNKASDPGTLPAASFIIQSAMRYDSLNRRVVFAQQAADGSFDMTLDSLDYPLTNQTLFTLTGYDSRGNRTLSIDPNGNSTEQVYDGARRRIRTIQHLRLDGHGDNPPPDGTTLLPDGGAAVTTTMLHDANGRVTQLIDDRGGTTLYTYDTLDRQLTMTFHDGSTRHYEYNAASNVVAYTQENGTIINTVFDPIGRRTSCTIAAAPGINGTDAQEFRYDGLSRPTQLVDTVGDVDAVVDLFYDSLGRVLEDSQTYNSGPTRNVTNSAFTSHPVTTFTFPNGRQITNTYDEIYRRTMVEDGVPVPGPTTLIAEWRFMGRNRIGEVVLGATSGGHNVYCAFLSNDRQNAAVQTGVPNPAWGDGDDTRLGYDGAGRMIAKRWLFTEIVDGEYDAPAPVVGFTTAFDHASNKMYERHLHAPTRSHLYQPFTQVPGGVDYVPGSGYDSLNRLRQYQRGELDSTIGQHGQGGGEVDTAITLPNTDTSRSYTLDGLGNWKNTAFTPVGGSATTQFRDHNKLNQITRTLEGVTAVNFAYDEAPGESNGNLADDGVRIYAYDPLNRLRLVKRKSNNQTIAVYFYDARGFRIRKLVTGAGGVTGDIPESDTFYIYNTNWQCVEERNDSNEPIKQYIWGTYIDELIQLKTLEEITTGSGATEETYPAGDYYPMQDLLYRTTATVNSSGVIVEAYDTDAYGNTLIFNAPDPGTSSWWTEDAQQVNNALCEHIFTGMRYDVESRLYYYRTRQYDALTGRLLIRDPVGYDRVLSLFAYCGSMPIGFVDPYGWRESPAGFCHHSDYLRPNPYDDRMMGVNRVVFDREDYLALISPPDRPEDVDRLIDAGCLGLCMLRLGITDPSTKLPTRRTHPRGIYKDVRCYREFAHALAIARDRCDRCFDLFAIQGHRNVQYHGEWAREDVNVIDPRAIDIPDPRAANAGDFNFATCHPSTSDNEFIWESVNAGVAERDPSQPANAEGRAEQRVILQKSGPEGLGRRGEGQETIYCIKCKFR